LFQWIKEIDGEWIGRVIDEVILPGFVYCLGNICFIRSITSMRIQVESGLFGAAAECVNL